MSVESWRVVTSTTAGRTSFDVVVRLRAGAERLLVTGEGATADEPLRALVTVGGGAEIEASQLIGT